MDKLKEKPRLFPLIIQRWADLFILSIISALIFVILHPIVVKLSDKLAKLLPQSNTALDISIPILIFLFLVTTYLWFLLIHLGGFRYRTRSQNIVLRSLRKAYLY
ncbi:MAG: hypothetical protein Q7J12_09455, partial [Syntrophales bacterium]|nr:hypothetical protein [Syntrophales bacterium]